MGDCCSKENAASPSHPLPSAASAEKKTAEGPLPNAAVVAAITEKKQQVSVITHKSAGAVTAANDKEKVGEMPTRKASRDLESNGSAPILSVPASALRTSSCTKEEIDAILIQCGRLSRSSSGKACNDRKYPGLKRSYDFDCEKKGEEWEEKPVFRSSPHRRTPGRERSGSRERGSGGGGRRTSRSPGRRTDVPSSPGLSSEKSKQPVKMVAVPAREKGWETSLVLPVNKKGDEVGAVRNSSPRSRSPAGATGVLNDNAASYHASPLNQLQSLGRCSPRKAEQSPYRRNPLAEVDVNCIKGNQNNNNIQKTREWEEAMPKQNQCQAQKTAEVRAQGRRSLQRNGDRVHGKISTEPAELEEATEKLTSSRVAEENHISRTISTTRSPRRSSRDLDHAYSSLGFNQETFLNPNSSCPSSLLLDDIQAYNQQHADAAFSLSACVSKACSILETVADLNSTSSENDCDNARRLLGSRFNQPFVESETVAKGSFGVKPKSAQNVTVRDLIGGGDMDPQESAGSNSLAGQAWASSALEPNSEESTSTWRPNNGYEVEHEAKVSPLRHGRQQQQEFGARASGLKVASGISSGSGHVVPSIPNEKKRELYQSRQLRRAVSGEMGGSGARACSLPPAAAAASR